MARERNLIPTYRRLKRKNSESLAFVDLGGKRFYLGRYGSPESRQAYQRLLAECQNDGEPSSIKVDDITIVEIAARFEKWAREYYVKNGKITTEPISIHRAMVPLSLLYGRTRARQFSPRCLVAVQKKMLLMDWSRKYINDQIFRIKKMFKWAVAKELLPASVYHALQVVEGLRKGRCSARENPPVKPVPHELIKSVKSHVSRQVAVMIDLQLLTGARAGELVIMRAVDIDMSQAVWLYRPASHKTEHHDKDRVIPLGPQAQEIIRPFLTDRPIHACLFSPAEAEAQRRVKQYENRITPLSCGNRPGTHCKNTASWGDHYTTDSYRRAIDRGCQKAFPPPPPLAQRDDETVPQWEDRIKRDKLESQLKDWEKQHHWHPHQLRHNYATQIRRQYGLEIAQILLGHSKADVTQIYAERDLSRALEVASKIG